MKKFIDLLFEPEEENKSEVIAEGPLVDLKTKPEASVKSNIKPSIPKVSETRHSFIDLDELKTPKTKKKENKDSGRKVYEFHKPISPVFGYIGENKNNDYILHTPQLKDSTPSALGTIISPYYGPTNTGKKEDKIDKDSSKEKSLDKTEITLTSVINQPTKNSDKVSNDYENINVSEQEKNEQIADTEISLFDELFSSDED